MVIMIIKIMAAWTELISRAHPCPPRLVEFVEIRTTIPKRFLVGLGSMFSRARMDQRKRNIDITVLRFLMHIVS